MQTIENKLLQSSPHFQSRTLQQIAHNVPQNVPQNIPQNPPTSHKTGSNPHNHPLNTPGAHTPFPGQLKSDKFSLSRINFLQQDPQGVLNTLPLPATRIAKDVAVEFNSSDDSDGDGHIGNNGLRTNTHHNNQSYSSSVNQQKDVVTTSPYVVFNRVESGGHNNNNNNNNHSRNLNSSQISFPSPIRSHSDSISPRLNQYDSITNRDGDNTQVNNTSIDSIESAKQGIKVNSINMNSLTPAALNFYSHVAAPNRPISPSSSPDRLQSSIHDDGKGKDWGNQSKIDPFPHKNDITSSDTYINTLKSNNTHSNAHWDGKPVDSVGNQNTDDLKDSQIGRAHV